VLLQSPVVPHSSHHFLGFEVLLLALLLHSLLVLLLSGSQGGLLLSEGLLSQVCCSFNFFHVFVFLIDRSRRLSEGLLSQVSSLLYLVHVLVFLIDGHRRTMSQGLVSGVGRGCLHLHSLLSSVGGNLAHFKFLLGDVGDFPVRVLPSTCPLNEGTSDVF